METTIRINTDLLTQEVIEGIKKLFPHRIVDIIVQPADDTEYILSTEAYTAELKERIVDYESGKETVKVNPDELK